MTVRSEGPAADGVGVKTVEVCRRFAAPDYVKRASSQDLYGHRSTPTAVYADGRARTYAVHTPAAAWLSAAFYHYDGVSDPPLEAGIKSALDRFRFPEVWGDLAAKAAEVRAQGPEPDYALPKYKRYPINTPDRIKKAAHYLAAHAGEFDPEDRREYASNLLKAAAAKKALDDDWLCEIERYAGLGRPLVKAAEVVKPYAQWARVRKEPRLAELLEKAANAVDSGADPYPFAALLKKAAVKLKYSWHCDPEMMLTGAVPTRLAPIPQRYVRADDGSWFKKADLEKVPTDALIRAFGTGPIVSPEKRAELLVEYGPAFRRLLADCGVKPHREAPPNLSQPTVDWAALV